MRQIRKLTTLVLAMIAMALAGAAPVAAETGFEWAPDAGDELVFDVYRNGKPFGSHVVRFDRADQQLTVKTDIELKVKFGPITAFHYVHDASETWVDGALQSVDARTRSEGRWKDVSARAEAAGLQTKGPGFTGLHPAGLIPSTHWNVAEMRQSEMLSTETGAILPMQVEDLGLERVRVGEGSVEARHYRVTSDLVASFWYDEQGRWVKCAFKARGSDVEYVLRALPG